MQLCNDQEICPVGIMQAIAFEQLFPKDQPILRKERETWWIRQLNMEQTQDANCILLFFQKPPHLPISLQFFPQFSLQHQ